MFNVTLPPLTPECEAIRQQIANLPDVERRRLLGCIGNDNIRRNDIRHAEAHARAERARKRPKGQTEMSLESAA